MALSSRESETDKRTLACAQLNESCFNYLNIPSQNLRLSSTKRQNLINRKLLHLCIRFNWKNYYYDFFKIKTGILISYCWISVMVHTKWFRLLVPFQGALQSSKFRSIHFAYEFKTWSRATFGFTLKRSSHYYYK